MVLSETDAGKLVASNLPKRKIRIRGEERRGEERRGEERRGEERRGEERRGEESMGEELVNGRRGMVTQ
jgi:hypothetical protein